MNEKILSLDEPMCFKCNKHIKFYRQNWDGVDWRCIACDEPFYMSIDGYKQSFREPLP